LVISFNEFLYICWKSTQYKQWNYISKNTKWFVLQNFIPPIEDKMIVILIIVENKMVGNIAILKVDVITMIWLTVTGYLCHKCFVCRNHNPILSSCMAYHQVCNKSNARGVNCGAGTAYSSEAPQFIPGFSGVRVARSSM
jgi:hypothetical protein